MYDNEQTITTLVVKINKAVEIVRQTAGALPLILIIKSYFESNILSRTPGYRDVASTGNGVVEHTDSSRQRSTRPL